MKLVSENDIPTITPLTPEQLAAAKDDPRFDPVLDPAKDDFDLDKLLRDFEAGKWHGSISVRGHTIEDLEKQICGEEPPNHGPTNEPEYNHSESTWVHVRR